VLLTLWEKVMRVNHANTMRRRNDKIKKNAKKKNVINDLHIKVR